MEGNFLLLKYSSMTVKPQELIFGYLLTCYIRYIDNIWY